MSASGTAADGTAYTDFLAKFNNGTSTDGGAGTPVTGCFAGHCDWRLPTIVELQRIVDVTQGLCTGSCISPACACIDSVFGPTQDGDYWSATTAEAPGFAWDTDFDSGDVDFDDKTNNIEYVRAVRGGL